MKFPLESSIFIVDFFIILFSDQSVQFISFKYSVVIVGARVPSIRMFPAPLLHFQAFPLNDSYLVQLSLTSIFLWLL